MHKHIHLAASLLLFASAPLCAQTNNVPVPPDAPTVNCQVKPDNDASTLRILAAPATFVFACGKSKEHPGCYASTASLPKKPTDTQIIATGEAHGAWTCVFFDSVPGWLPTNSLAPLPTQPTPPLNSWLGWYRKGKDYPHIQNDRLLITRGKTPGTLRVSGRAFWYGLGDDVHFGQINAEATPVGHYLHLVDGNDIGACVLDLTLDPSTHTLAASDNDNCGGMNVRFWGKWQRFTPSTQHKK